LVNIIRSQLKSMKREAIMDHHPDTAKIAAAFRDILEALGEDPEREGLLGTPERVARMYTEIFSGIQSDPRDFLDVSFTEFHDELVLVKDIPVYSMCEHHFLPFYGMAHVAYIPKGGKVVGISKLARVVETYARRPQLQERLTSQIADCIFATLNPMGVGVVIQAEHMCMSMRGVKKPGALTVTSALRGIFQSRAESRAELFSLILK